VDVACPKSDVGGQGVIFGSEGERRGRSPERALFNYLRFHTSYPVPLPDWKHFSRAKTQPRWVPMVYREDDRILGVVRTKRVGASWNVYSVYACDSLIQLVKNG
jgi:hypothetical protein